VRQGAVDPIETGETTVEVSLTIAGCFLYREGAGEISRTERNTLMVEKGLVARGRPSRALVSVGVQRE
jgi:hypothetical protein